MVAVVPGDGSPSGSVASTGGRVMRCINRDSRITILDRRPPRASSWTDMLRPLGAKRQRRREEGKRETRGKETRTAGCALKPYHLRSLSTSRVLRSHASGNPAHASPKS